MGCESHWVLSHLSSSPHLPLSHLGKMMRWSKVFCPQPQWILACLILGSGRGCLSKSFHCWNKTLWPKAAWGGRKGLFGSYILSHSPWWKPRHEHKAETCRQKPWKKGTLLACSRGLLSLFSYKIISPGVALPAVIWALLHHLLIRKMAHRLVHMQILWKHFLRCVLSSQITLTCAKVTQS